MFVIYLYYLKSYELSLIMYLLLSSLTFNYLLNILCIIVQNCYLRGDTKFNRWLKDGVNRCWFYFVSIVSLLTLHKFKNIMFCKLFNFNILSAQLDNVQRFKIFNIFAFLGFISSAIIIIAAILLLITFK